MRNVDDVEVEIYTVRSAVASRISWSIRYPWHFSEHEALEMAKHKGELEVERGELGVLEKSSVAVIHVNLSRPRANSLIKHARLQ